MNKEQEEALEVLGKSGCAVGLDHFEEGCIRSALAHISTLEKENARLRGALEDAEEALTQVCVDINAPYVGKCWCSIADLTDKATWKAVLVARAALSGAPKEGT